MEPNLEQLIEAAQAHLALGTQSFDQSSSAPAPGIASSTTSPEVSPAASPEVPPSASPISPSVMAIAERLLRSRKIGRPPKGLPLAGIYQVICDRLQNTLLQLLPSALSQYHPQRISAREWGQNLVTQASQDILEDALLKQLALEAQSHPAQTPLRQHALMQLLEGIRLSGRLARPHRTKFSPQFYDLLYEEAVNRTLTYVCRRIDTYDPERGEKQKFMNWVNFRLDRMVIECRRDVDEEMVEGIPSLDELEVPVPPNESESLVDVVRECIAKDAEQVFTKAHIRNRPDASFQAIALARFDGKSWDEISRDLSIKIPTLSSFFQRCCQKFAPIFHAYSTA